MDDFLYNLRNSARKKTSDRRRKPFEGNVSGGNRKNEREYPQEKAGDPMTRVLTDGRIDRLEKYLQEWIDAIKSLESVQRQRLTTEERLVSTMDRIAGQLEKIVALGVMDETLPRIVQRIPSRVLDLSENPDASQTSEPWSRERIVHYVQDLHRGGMKEEEILMTLMASKVPTLNGKGTWRIQSVQRICRQVQQT